jgi:hypothetical protein
MQPLTIAGQNLVNNLSNHYNISPDAVIHMIIAVNNGGGTMAQFNSPELGGSGQWMKGGMTMVGDMFNSGLKWTVDNICSEISNALATTQIFPTPPPGSRSSNQWWPANMGIPFSSGAQNNIRYAVFPQRLVIESNGQVTVYDTLNHNIGGVSQQQGGDTSLTFSSQFGTISVNSLPIVSGPGDIPPAPQTNFADPVASGYQADLAPQQESMNQTTTSMDSNAVIQLIEKLAQLHEAGALSDDEYHFKKTELLNRL